MERTSLEHEERIAELNEGLEEAGEPNFAEVDERIRTVVHEPVCNIRRLDERLAKLERTASSDARSRSDYIARTELLEVKLENLENELVTQHRARRDVEADMYAAGTRAARLEESVRDLGATVERQERSTAARFLDSRAEVISWFQDVTMGTRTMQDFSLLDGEKTNGKKKSKPKPKHKSKGSSRRTKHRSRHDDDPDSSDSSSSSSNSSEADEPERSRKSRRRDTDSDDDSDSEGAGRRSRKRDSRRESKLLDPKHFGSRHNRASILGGDDDSGSKTTGTTQRGNTLQTQDSIIFVQPTPVVQTLQLTEVTVGKVMHFCKTFNNESSRFRGGLNASNYIDDRLLCQMRQVALKHDLPGQDGILSNGRQKITNKEIFAILAMMCAPTSKEEMQRQLAKSVWPNKNEFKTVEQIMKSIREYRTEMLIYVDRFEDKL
ncbi:MAG: hypothetical protein CGW95_10675, partial [Phenylobacterium zucineum]